MLAQNLQMAVDNWFSSAKFLFDSMVEHFNSEETNRMTCSEIERFTRENIDNVARELIQGKLNKIGRLEAETVVGSDGVAHIHKKLRERTVGTLYGDVSFSRWGYRAESGDSLFPADGHLNLPPEKYSHELRRRVSEDIARSSYDETLDELSRRTEAKVPKRQALELVNRAAQDFTYFYDTQAINPEASGVTSQESGSLLIFTTDGKGVSMRPEGLREGTRKAAEKKQQKLKKRLSPGEKSDRKRMAQVASVYNVAPHFRTAEEIAGCVPVDVKKKKGPRPEDKRVWASLEDEPEQVITEMFKEGEARDPSHAKTCVALVDGNPTQLRLVKEQARAFGVTLTIIIDIIHVLEYLWKASHAFYKEGDPLCEKFVSDRFLRVLHGQCSQVAKGIRKMATDRDLPEAKRKVVDTCASYLLKYKAYLRYDEYLAQGFPIATGVIEGACRYLVKDRMDITGARWGLPGGEAVLKLRSLRVSSDFDEYWSYHEQREQERNHNFKYEDGKLPPLIVSYNKANVVSPKSMGRLQLVKG